MIEREDAVAALLAAAPGGQLVSRIRLQKTVYLLQRLGWEAGMEFDYHHYGPYSRDLDLGTSGARALGLIDEDIRRRQSDGAQFSIFHLKAGPEWEADPYGALGRERVAALIEMFAGTNLTVLELAATVDWLVSEEGRDDWREEIRRRKGWKVEGGRLEQAVDLLGRLGLAPREESASA